MTTYSFRAECRADAEAFQALVMAGGQVTDWRTVSDDGGYPDVEVEFKSQTSLEALRGMLRTLVDGHVMLQTLQPVPLADNSLERDFDIE
jgi:hypothetical protein